MSSTPAPSPLPHPRPVTLRRTGYTVAIAVNAVVLWGVHRLLAWNWPGFLTDDFERVLPLLTASLIATLVSNAVFLLRDHGRVRALGDLVTSVFAVVVGVRMWSVFPFDFSGYARDWNDLVRVMIAVTIAATAVAVIVNLVQLVTGRAGPDG